MEDGTEECDLFGAFQILLVLEGGISFHFHVEYCGIVVHNGRFEVSCEGGEELVGHNVIFNNSMCSEVLFSVLDYGHIVLHVSVLRTPRLGV